MADFSYFITGAALGFDITCAEIILEFKKEFPHIKLECAIPCKDQYKLWTQEQIKRYKNVLKKADKIRCIYKHYVNGCMQERNRYMVNNSSLVIALYDGKSKGGTQQTLEYAKKQGIKISIIQPIE